MLDDEIKVDYKASSGGSGSTLSLGCWGNGTIISGQIGASEMEKLQPTSNALACSPVPVLRAAIYVAYI